MAWPIQGDQSPKHFKNSGSVDGLPRNLPIGAGMPEAPPPHARGELITSAQCRAARVLLDWTEQQLAEAARIGNATIRNFESGRSSPQNATLDVLRWAFETAGVIFIDENGQGPGVRLRKMKPDEGKRPDQLIAENGR